MPDPTPEILEAEGDDDMDNVSVPPIRLPDIEEIERLFQLPVPRPRTDAEMLGPLLPYWIRRLKPYGLMLNAEGNFVVDA